VNLILLDDDDFVGPNRVRLSGRRAAHVRQVHRARLDDVLRVGRMGGLLGSGRVLALDDDAVELEVALSTEPPAPLQVALVVALPRPPSLRKVLQQATALGVKEIVLLHTRRVEKSYWQSHGLQPAALRHELLLGLEQARDTRLPRVELRQRFRPFVEDELPGLLAAGRGLVAHPESDRPCPRAVAEPLTLIVGPEGGFVPFELELLLAQSVEPISLGPRVLRVETAVVALLARLAP
jgi:RsmE family RNA methyltransferase